MIKSLEIGNLPGITQDSRAVKKGYLFAALPGTRADGRQFIADAVQNGARYILALRGTPLPAGAESVELIEVDNPRLALARIARDFYAHQPAYVAAVTGTNGKTSTVTFAQQLWQMEGIKAASLGTLGLRAAAQDVGSGAMTTPDTVTLHAELADLAAVGIDHLAMEASSHGLDQFRLHGVRVRAAGFTNLSRDHLDYHTDMQRYLASKMRLFSEVLEPDGVAVLNADIPEYAALKAASCARIFSYGEKGEALRLRKAEPTATGSELEVEAFGRTHTLTLPLVGRFQIMNALCALGLVLAETPDDPERAGSMIERLSDLQGVPGRMQLVQASNSNGAGVYVDYAHTPDALETVLKALRPHTEGRLICLFGCGGDRDTGKRPEMGAIAMRLADHVIVTDDNPRSEDPARIRAAILAAAQGAQEIGGRCLAISEAVKMMKPGDVLLIAGKGHERGQIFVDHTEEFDDYTVAQSAIEELAKS